MPKSNNNSFFNFAISSLSTTNIQKLEKRARVRRKEIMKERLKIANKTWSKIPDAPDNFKKERKIRFSDEVSLIAKTKEEEKQLVQLDLERLQLNPNEFYDELVDEMSLTSISEDLVDLDFDDNLQGLVDPTTLLPEYNLDRGEETYYNTGQNSGSSSQSIDSPKKAQKLEQNQQRTKTQDTSGMTDYYEQLTQF